MSKNYSLEADRYAEMYGLVVYRVEGKYIIYNVSYPQYLGNPAYTVQHKVNLDTLEHTSKTLKRFDRRGYLNR